MHTFRCLVLSSLLLFCHFVETVRGCCTMFVWNHHASLRACRLICVCVCVCECECLCGWVDTRIILLDITPLCLGVHGCDYVLHYVGLNRLSTMRACVQTSVTCCVVLRRPDVLAGIER